MKPSKIKSRLRCKGAKTTKRWPKKGKPSQAANPR